MMMFGLGTSTCATKFQVAPLKAGAVNPEAVEQNRDLASNRHCRLFHADPLRQANAPRLQRRPFLCPVHEDAGRFV